jgi:hypothetical protein
VVAELLKYFRVCRHRVFYGRRDNPTLCPRRGSSAGLCSSYCLNICATQSKPYRHRVSFLPVGFEAATARPTCQLPACLHTAAHDGASTENNNFRHECHGKQPASGVLPSTIIRSRPAEIQHGHGSHAPCPVRAPQYHGRHARSGILPRAARPYGTTLPAAPVIPTASRHDV